MDLNELLQHEFQYSCQNVSDINEHIPLLRWLGDQCESITEFGVRHGVSTRAFLSSSAKSFRLYDISSSERISYIIDICREHGMDVEYIIANDLEITITPTDLLFIDTSHTYAQLSAELQRHHNQVRKYIVMHDTEYNGTVDEFGNSPALTGALLQFLAHHPEWHIRLHHTNNCGMTVIARANIVNI